MNKTGRVKLAAEDCRLNQILKKHTKNATSTKQIHLIAELNIPGYVSAYAMFSALSWNRLEQTEIVDQHLRYLHTHTRARRHIRRHLYHKPSLEPNRAKCTKQSQGHTNVTSEKSPISNPQGNFQPERHRSLSLQIKDRNERSCLCRRHQETRVVLLPLPPSSRS